MINRPVKQGYDVGTLQIDKLLADWRWLCPEQVSLVARNAFGDLFLKNIEGKIFWLQVTTGQLAEIAASEAEFHDLLEREECRKAWFCEADAQAFDNHGFRPNATQCIGFKIPLIFSESKDVPDNAYVADLYEQVSFLGDLHRQVANSPDGSLVRLRPIE